MNELGESIAQIIIQSRGLFDLYTEEWRPIVNFEDKYLISSLGRVKSIGRQDAIKHYRESSILKLYKTPKGYLRICLSINGLQKKYSVHRLVAESFVNNPHNKKDVNHKFGVKSLNLYSELEWITCSENHLHAFEVLGKKPNTPWKGKVGNNAIGVAQISLCGHFLFYHESISAAARFANVKPLSIRKSLSGLNNCSQKFIWK